ncbi:MAG TPA: dockerin type I domain-containing protein [Chitinophagaceae bacterium]|nr:dockerin type I domain-containing protein [Chitinophagaceae bacterium]
MKKLSILFIILFFAIQTDAQSIHRSVIGSAGNVSISGNLELSSTIGETFTQTLSSSTHKITQGFQQGKKTDSTNLYLLLYLQGYYSYGYSMQSTLYNQGRSNDQSITDTITVELHPASNPAIISAQVKTILNTNTNANCMMHVDNGNYYIVIKHRNHVETWSANPVSFNGTFAYYDFTWSASQAYGNNLVEIEPGYFALYAGDLNQDENVDLIDIGILENDINNFAFGYYTTDINGDGNVDLLDAAPVEANVNGFIFSNHP